MTLLAGSAGADPRPAFSPLTAVWTVLVGVFAFSALVVLTTYAPELDNGDNGEAQALSRSAVGFAGLVEALQFAGEPVVVNRAPLSAKRRGGLLILTPTPTADEAAIDALAFGGPVLVVLPKWQTAPDLQHKGWVARGPLITDLPSTTFMGQLGLRARRGASRPLLRGVDPTIMTDLRLQAGRVDDLRSISSTTWIPILTDDAGATILARDPHRPLFVLADPDLLDTQGVKDIDTLGCALAILRGLRAQQGVFIFDVRLNGLGKEPSVLRLLFDPPFLAVTLCLAAAAGLAGFQAFFRFGPVARGGRLIPLGKAVLVDNTAAMIRMAGREHRMAGRYADVTAELTARAVGAPRGMGGQALELFLDRLAIQRGLPESFSDLAIQARMAQTAEKAVASAGRLFRWRLDVMGGDARAGGASVDPSRVDRP